VIITYTKPMEKGLYKYHLTLNSGISALTISLVPDHVSVTHNG